MISNINIAALLKDCPRGTKLYSPVCGECEFDGITYHQGYIKISFNKKENGLSFDKYGHLCDDENLNGECLLFPSREVRDWGIFHARYVVMSDDRKHNMKLLELFGKVNNEKAKELLSIKGIDNKKIVYLDRVINCLCDDDDSCSDKTNPHYDPSFEYILSTGTELKLEEEPKFKVGDVVIANCDRDRQEFVFIGENGQLWFDGLGMEHCKLSIERLATSEEIDKWNEETLQPNHLHYSKSKRKIIDWFIEFDRVVVRKNVLWVSRLFDYYTKSIHPYRCQDGNEYNECLPYNENTAKLIGTTDDYKE